MTALAALLGAAAYGLGDFCGGFASRRVSAWTVAFVVQVVGTVATGIAALVAGGHPGVGDLGWAVVAGLANGLGTTALYRGLAGGRMGVVAPVSGVGAAVLPVVAALLYGERPGGWAWVGIIAALPAIWLVSRQPAADADPAMSDPAMSGSAGLVDGIVAGAGFGILFIALSRVGPDAGLLPLALNQLVAALTVVAVATALHEPWLPQHPGAAWGAISGLLGATATGVFLVVSRGGHLTVTAVVVSLYPAVTVILATLVLRERIHRAQGVGLLLCVCAATLVAAG